MDREKLIDIVDSIKSSTGKDSKNMSKHSEIKMKSHMWRFPEKLLLLNGVIISLNGRPEIYRNIWHDHCDSLNI